MEKDYTAENEQFTQACASYGWLNILRAFTPLVGAIDYIGTRKEKRLDICPDSKCSGHQLWKSKGNFELFKDADEHGAGYCYKCQKRYSGMDSVMNFNGWDFPSAKKEIKQLIGFENDPNYKPSERKVTQYVPKGPSQSELLEAKQNRKAMNTTWSEALYLNDERALPVAKYFAKRGITSLQTLMKGNVKFHPCMPFYIPLSHSSEDVNEEDKMEREHLLKYCQAHPSFKEFRYRDGEPTMANMGNHPCILIMVRTHDGQARRIHRIFIDNDGNKASFHLAGFEVKKMMPGGYGLEVTGCYCHIDPPSEVVGIGEGLETVLAVKQVTDMPMDCTINAGGLKNYIPKFGTKLVFIFEDKDLSKTGELAAIDAEKRLIEEFGVAVIRLTPPIELNGRKSIDWLDVLNELGESGFPEIAKKWREFSKVA
ncbi:toprim domain-containing protein [Vibrio sp. 1180_3]|uniref:toprim domain-containing protein n=1 Tax=Vibrio sp. 1180_3 TaxID=2528832 RepID=UPI0024069797|nr:toprim domain-containing protein [Vibrio sp. 1180_3]MDF9399118.1 hypothetical protein [Vibrio sp. 1180_3]